jgi:monofunctional biosynthetic peptidoglycan transglycosylase
MSAEAQGTKHRSLFFRIIKWCVYAVLFFIGFSLIQVISLRYVNPICTPLMLGRWVSGKLSGDSVGIDYRWKPLNEISTSLQKSVIASEDRKFFYHHGFDWDAIETNWDKLEDGQKNVKGGSTISMQTARNIFLWQGRSWVRKGLEAYYTVLIEFFWGKKRILEMYLNVIEMGSGIYGAEAASQEYFHHSANFLAPPEAALITAVLPNPRKWSPVKPTSYIKRREAIILHRMMGTPLPRKFLAD